MAGERPPSFSARGKWSIGFSVTASIWLALALTIMANYLAARHYRRFSLTTDDRFQLSQETHRVLQTLTNDVNITIVFDADPQDTLYGLVSGLLKEYRFACPRLRVQTVDYVRDPGTAELMTAKYRLPENEKNLVIFDSNGKTKVVHGNELSEYDFSKLTRSETNEIKRTGFKGELLFTSAIVNVIEGQQPKAYFLAGHGEHDPTSDEKTIGYSKCTVALKLNNIQVEKLLLSGTNDIPVDCQLLVIAGPKSPFLETDLAKLESYLNRGGRLFVLLDFLFQAGGRQIGLERLLAKWGVAVGNNFVTDQDNTMLGQDLVIREFTPHPIMRPLLQSSLSLYLVRAESISKLENGPSSPDAAKVESIAFTGKRGITRSEMRGGIAYQDPHRDAEGNKSVIVAVEKGSIQGVSADQGTTRMVVVGDAMLLENDTIDKAGNREFASLAANWLLDRAQLMGGIGPRPIKEYFITLTESQMTSVRWLLLAGLPGGVLLLGGIVWLRRRT